MPIILGKQLRCNSCKEKPSSVKLVNIHSNVPLEFQNLSQMEVLDQGGRHLTKQRFVFLIMFPIYKTQCINVSVSLVFRTNHSKWKKTLSITVFMELRNTGNNQENLVRPAYVKNFLSSVPTINWSCHLKNLFNDVYTTNIIIWRNRNLNIHKGWKATR